MRTSPVNLHLRNNLATMFPNNAIHRIIIGATVINRVLVMNDIGDVGGILNHRNVLRPGNDQP